MPSSEAYLFQPLCSTWERQASTGSSRIGPSDSDPDQVGVGAGSSWVSGCHREGSLGRLTGSSRGPDPEMKEPFFELWLDVTFRSQGEMPPRP